ncbi:hypothetical protein K502DRAFT_354042 [Neoconidiobolus thromboides FSU 785]|nr:hypothetical protein K502DRAFT_354042 [Neoconidiobolus thromboides FSU 785]
MSSGEAVNNLSSISNGLNILSVVSSVIVLVFFIITAIFEQKLINRTSLRLQVGVSIVNLLNAAFALQHHTVKTGNFCKFIAFWRNFGEQMYCFLNIAIALNLQLIYIQSKKPKRVWEQLYWGLSLTLSLALSFVPLSNFNI